MDKEKMLTIAKEEKIRFQMLKNTCEHCVPDDLMEWIDAVIEMIKDRK